MTDEIEADVPPWSEPEFDTPAGAIEHAKKIANRTSAGEDLTPHLGRTISAVHWRDDACRLCLGDDFALQFEIVGRTVDLTVSKVPLESHWAAGCIGPSVSVRFREGVVRWPRADLMTALVGNELRRVQPGGLTFLYVSNVGILQVSVLIDRQSLRPFLYWTPTN